MDAAPQSRARTRLFARALGPFLVIADATAVARASDMQARLSQFQADSLWTWVTGAFILLFGLFIVAATHNRPVGGAGPGIFLVRLPIGDPRLQIDRKGSNER